jgi:acyl-CoA thioester hydrolase
MPLKLAETGEFAMAYPAPFVGPLITVEDQWTDFNHHLNMAYYNVIFDRAGDHFFEEVGLGPDYVKTRNGSTFTLECHVTYVRELHAGTAVRIASQILDCDSKRVHYVQQMYHAEGNWLACVSEIIIMHVDMGTKKSAPFPPDVLAKLQAMHEAHKSLPVPPQVGHKIGIPRKPQ